MQKMRDKKKAIRHVEKKEHNDRRKSLLISKCFKYKWNKLSEQKTEIGMNKST